MPAYIFNIKGLDDKQVSAAGKKYHLNKLNYKKRTDFWCPEEFSKSTHAHLIIDGCSYLFLSVDKTQLEILKPLAFLVLSGMK